MTKEYECPECRDTYVTQESSPICPKCSDRSTGKKVYLEEK